MLEKTKIKDIFDNIKNYLACGAVLYAAIFTFKIPTTSLFGKWQNIFTGIFLIVGFLILLGLNSHHAIHVYFPKFKEEKNLKKRAVAALFFMIYIILSIPLVLSIASKTIISQTANTQKNSQAIINR